MLGHVGGLMVDHRISPPGINPRGRIVFVRGMWGGSWYFENWLQTAVSRGHETVAINLPGHHGSNPLGKGLGKTKLGDYVEAVNWVMRILNISRFTIIGHSMGGLIAQKVAEMNKNCTRAVFVTSAPPRGIFIRGPVLPKLLKHLGSIFGSMELMPSPEDFRTLMLNGMNHTEQADVLAKLVPESGRAARDMILWRVGVNRKLMPPCLVVGGTADRLTPPSMQRVIARKYSAEYAEFPNGHMMMLEEGWEKPINKIINWLGSS